MRTVRRSHKEISLEEAEDFASSARVSLVAPLGNTDEDNYYRNDSPIGSEKGVVSNVPMIEKGIASCVGEVLGGTY